MELLQVLVALYIMMALEVRSVKDGRLPHILQYLIACIAGIYKG